MSFLDLQSIRRRFRILTAAIAIVLTGLFGLSERTSDESKLGHSTDSKEDRSLKNIPILGVPASLAFGCVIRRPAVELAADQKPGSELCS